MNADNQTSENNSEEPDKMSGVWKEKMVNNPKAVTYGNGVAEIIDYATKCEDEEFLIATEIGVFHELQKRNPDKKFYPVKDSQICPNMKKITLEKVLNVLETFDNQVELHEEIRQKANYPLSRMLELAK